MKVFYKYRCLIKQSFNLKENNFFLVFLFSYPIKRLDLQFIFCYKFVYLDKSVYRSPVEITLFAICTPKRVKIISLSNNDLKGGNIFTCVCSVKGIKFRLNTHPCAHAHIISDTLCPLKFTSVDQY